VAGPLAAPPPGSRQISTGCWPETAIRPLLGDFLAAASGHIDIATGDLRLDAEAAPSVVGELVRLTAVMVRSADAFVQDDRGDSRHLLDAQRLATLDARSASSSTTACRSVVGLFG
jgi:hypothetical protein